MPQNSDSFVSHLELSLAWEQLGAPPAQPLRDAAAEASARILAVLLHGIELDARPRPTDEQLLEALVPIRARLDIVIEMLARLSYRDVALPPRQSVEIGDRIIAWHAEETPARGDWLRLCLYFDPTIREPVVIFAQVTATTPATPAGTCRIEAMMAELPEPLLGDLERLALLTQRHQHAHRVAGAMGKREW